MGLIKSSAFFLDQDAGGKFWLSIILEPPSYGQEGYQAFQDGQTVTVHWELLLGREALEEIDGLSEREQSLLEKGYLANKKDFFDDESTSGSVNLSRLTNSTGFHFTQHKNGFEEDELFGVRLRLEGEAPGIEIQETAFYVIKGGTSHYRHPRLTIFDGGDILQRRRLAQSPHSKVKHER